MTGRHKSTIGSNFYHCVSRYNLNQWDFYNASVSVNDIVNVTVLQLETRRGSL